VGIYANDLKTLATLLGQSTNQLHLERFKAQLIDSKASLLQQEGEHKQSSQPVELDQTLLRIASEHYGTCVECDKNIGIRRLKFDPACIVWLCGEVEVALF